MGRRTGGTGSEVHGDYLVIRGCYGYGYAVFLKPRADGERVRWLEPNSCRERQCSTVPSFAAIEVSFFLPSLFF